MDVVASIDDIAFKDRFEAGNVAPSCFRHRDHLRLVFVYLCESNVSTANSRMRTSLKNFLQNNNVPQEKYHETLTLSWVHAVRYFMEKAKWATCFDEFLAIDERLLDPNLMLSHYRQKTLFSDQARLAFVEPDIQEIPQH